MKSAEKKSETAELIPGFHLLMDRVAAIQKMVDELSQRLPRYDKVHTQQSNTSQAVKKDKVFQKQGQTTTANKGNITKKQDKMQPPRWKEQASR